uniref:Uncharacterized protein n=1 Tax=Solanum lycopersicum TaxID=4081 RepID=A0A3Q7ISQ6_SOLLC
MCERGEIVMIDGERFLLPSESKNLNSKSKGKSKRRGSSSNTQKKLQQKEKEEDLEQQKKQGRGRLAKNKEDGAKNVMVQLQHCQQRRQTISMRGISRARKTGVDPGAVLLKDLRLSRRRKTIKD